MITSPATFKKNLQSRFELSPRGIITKPIFLTKSVLLFIKSIAFAINGLIANISGLVILFLFYF